MAGPETTACGISYHCPAFRGRNVAERRISYTFFGARLSTGRISGIFAGQALEGGNRRSRRNLCIQWPRYGSKTRLQFERTALWHARLNGSYLARSCGKPLALWDLEAGSRVLRSSDTQTPVRGLKWQAAKLGSKAVKLLRLKTRACSEELSSFNRREGEVRLCPDNDMIDARAGNMLRVANCPPCRSIRVTFSNYCCYRQFAMNGQSVNTTYSRLLHPTPRPDSM